MSLWWANRCGRGLGQLLLTLTLIVLLSLDNVSSQSSASNSASGTNENSTAPPASLNGNVTQSSGNNSSSNSNSIASNSPDSTDTTNSRGLLNGFLNVGGGGGGGGYRTYRTYQGPGGYRVVEGGGPPDNLIQAQVDAHLLNGGRAQRPVPVQYEEWVPAQGPRQSSSLLHANIDTHLLGGGKHSRPIPTQVEYRPIDQGPVYHNNLIQANIDAQLLGGGKNPRPTYIDNRPLDQVPNTSNNLIQADITAQLLGGDKNPRPRPTENDDRPQRQAQNPSNSLIQADIAAQLLGDGKIPRPRPTDTDNNNLIQAEIAAQLLGDGKIPRTRPTDTYNNYLIQADIAAQLLGGDKNPRPRPADTSSPGTSTTTPKPSSSDPVDQTTPIPDQPDVPDTDPNQNLPSQTTPRPDSQNPSSSGTKSPFYPNPYADPRPDNVGKPLVDIGLIVGDRDLQKVGPYPDRRYPQNTDPIYYPYPNQNPYTGRRPDDVRKPLVNVALGVGGQPDNRDRSSRVGQYPDNIYSQYPNPNYDRYYNTYWPKPRVGTYPDQSPKIQQNGGPTPDDGQFVMDDLGNLYVFVNGGPNLLSGWIKVPTTRGIELSGSIRDLPVSSFQPIPGVTFRTPDKKNPWINLDMSFLTPEKERLTKTVGQNYAIGFRDGMKAVLGISDVGGDIVAESAGKGKTNVEADMGGAVQLGGTSEGSVVDNIAVNATGTQNNLKMSAYYAGLIAGAAAGGEIRVTVPARGGFDGVKTVTMLTNNGQNLGVKGRVNWSRSLDSDQTQPPGAPVEIGTENPTKVTTDSSVPK